MRTFTNTHTMSRLPIVLVHGYSDRRESFEQWCKVLEARGYDATTIHLGSYVSLSNEVTIKDIAEGFDRALRERAGLQKGEPFDAIVHSTGMLVIREWLSTYAGRTARLKRLIGLAPATFGSPMAHKGRSWLGGVFKGRKEFGPDFMEAGDQVLAGLELGSSYTWQLAHKDLLSTEVVYGLTRGTPYPFIMIGLDDYGWLKRVVTDEGTDGTIRWAGAGFNTRKVVVDLTVDPTQRSSRRRVTIAPWRNATVPLAFVPGCNHTSILREPTSPLIEMVEEALAVNSSASYAQWGELWGRKSADALKAAKAPRWQQFVTRAVDERGDGIHDYFLQLEGEENGKPVPLGFDLNVHAFREDPSYRCFHVDLDRLDVERLPKLVLRVIAESGSELVGYHGYSSPSVASAPRERGVWDAALEFDSTIGAKDVAFFWPYTTTLVEIRMNREPMPLTGANGVFWFGARHGETQP